VRLDLAALRINDPQRFAAVVTDPDLLRQAAPSASNADAAYVRGDLAEAVERYRTAILADPTDRSAWVGLALATRARDGQAAPILIDAPEVAYAVYGQIANGGGDPLDVVAWLSQPAG
jgi:hypothetical protein